MIRIKGSPYASTANFIATAADIAEYYGFEPFQNLPKTKPQQRALPPGARPDNDILYARRDERSLPSASRRLLASEHLLPVLAWRTVPISGSQGGISFELHAAGIPSAIAEALLIVVATAILKEARIANRTLMLNNMGGNESSARFLRDVSTYLRKNMDSIAASLRPRVATDPIGTLVQLIERGHPGIARAPQPMEYLTEDERRRFWQLIEYLEMSGLPYELSGHILGSRDCWAHSLYEITGDDSATGERVSFAFGGRYDPLMSRFARRPLPSAMIAIPVEEKGAVEVKERHPGIRAIYFAHLGEEARRRSLPLLENLRLSGIPVYHSLWHERMGEQMTAATSLATPFILIMGHKEAVEGTVMVREVATNSQEAISLSELPSYLRRKRVGVPLVSKS